MLEFIAGLGAGITVWAFLSMFLASRKDRKARDKDRELKVLHTRMMLFAWQVQDEAARNWYHRTEDLGTIARRYSDMSERIRIRDAAAADYFAAMGG